MARGQGGCSRSPAHPTAACLARNEAGGPARPDSVAFGGGVDSEALRRLGRTGGVWGLGGVELAARPTGRSGLGGVWGGVDMAAVHKLGASRDATVEPAGRLGRPSLGTRTLSRLGLRV